MINESRITGFLTIEHEADVCIIGAGAAGLFAAIAAARHGAKVALMHDRPMVGGNASSEIRMAIRGARGRDVKETGIVEELALANIRRNPTLNATVLDSVMHELVTGEPNIDLMLNCSCMDAKMDGGRVASVTGWQTTTQRFHQIKADIFIDCSGDSVLAPLTGAEFRMGREAADEFGEDISPEVSDEKTMGMSCLFQVRETDREVPFKAPDWAVKFTDETIGHRVHINDPDDFKKTNYWWIELGGEYDSIADTEKMRERLLPITFGVWDYYKNSGRFDAKNWELVWVGFLPGKRESRRYVGDYIMTQNDVRSGGQFDDIAAYGGWTLDDHHPGGFDTYEPPNVHHPAPSLYGIPYRCMYSKNIPNLMFAGRNISCTHVAMAACRVMATCAAIGQAVGTAAAMAVKEGITPREVNAARLKAILLEDDCYLPYNVRTRTPVMDGASAAAGGSDASVIFDGYDRDIGEEVHHLTIGHGVPLEITLPEARDITELRLILDSDINRDTFEGICRYNKTWPIRCHTLYHEPFVEMPKVLLRDFTVEYDNGNGWQTLASVTDNYRRLYVIRKAFTASRIRITPKASYGADKANIFSVILK